MLVSGRVVFIEGLTTIISLSSKPTIEPPQLPWCSFFLRQRDLGLTLGGVAVLTSTQMVFRWSSKRWFGFWCWLVEPRRKMNKLKNRKRDVKSWGGRLVFLFLIDFYVFVVTNMCGEDFSNFQLFWILEMNSKKPLHRQRGPHQLGSTLLGHHRRSWLVATTLHSDLGLSRRCLVKGEVSRVLKANSFFFDELEYLIYFRYDIHWYSDISKNVSICWCRIWYYWMRVMKNLILLTLERKVARPEAGRDFRHHH